jgi:DNA anti-recombination protein RmuC
MEPVLQWLGVGNRLVVVAALGVVIALVIGATLMARAIRHLRKAVEQWQTDSAQALESVSRAQATTAATLSNVQQETRQTLLRLQASYTTLQEMLLRSQKETLDLSAVLRSTKAQGHWGELQLQRVLELSGMLAYCDFEIQKHVSSNGKLQIPDVIIRLHNDRSIALDAKAPLESYYEAMSEQDETRRSGKLALYAKRVRSHMAELSKKEYWLQFHASPAVVILFLPAESMYRAAVEADHELLFSGFQQPVLLASPTTLIALLKAMSYGWSQERRAQSVQQIVDYSHVLQRELLGLDVAWKKLRKELDESEQAFLVVAQAYNEKVLPVVAQIQALDDTLQERDKAGPLELLRTVQARPGEVTEEFD